MDYKYPLINFFHKLKTTLLQLFGYKTVFRFSVNSKISTVEDDVKGKKI